MRSGFESGRSDAILKMTNFIPREFNRILIALRIISHLNGILAL